MRIACLLILSAISANAQDLEGMLSRKQSEIERKEASKSSAVPTTSPSPQMMELPRNSSPQKSETKRAEPKMSENKQSGFRRNWKTVPSTVSPQHAVGTYIHGKFTVQKISRNRIGSFNLLMSDLRGTKFLLFNQSAAVTNFFPVGSQIYAKDWCPFLIDGKTPSGILLVRAIAKVLDNKP